MAKIKIQGVSHEFAVIDDVKEDVINIVLNLKKVVFKVDDFLGDQVELKLLKKGKGEVYAKDIEVPTGVEIVNPDEYLFTISSAKKEVEIDLQVSRNIGYLSKEALTRGEKLKVGEIVLDTGFSPVQRVSYEVTNMRVGDRTDFNKITFNIETNGSVAPRETIQSAIKILINQLTAIVGSFEPTLANEVEEDIADKYSGNKDTIAVLDLDEEILGKLASAGIISLADLAQKTDLDLLKIDGIDEDAVEKIKKVLKK